MVQIEKLFQLNQLNIHSIPQMLVQIVVYETSEMHTLFQHDIAHSKGLFHLEFVYNEKNHLLNFDQMLKYQMIIA
jgi:hypothetical protein